MRVSFLFVCQPRLNSAAAAVETDVCIVPHNHVSLERVVNDGDVHVGDAAVVKEFPAAPLAACKSDAVISESIYDAAIKADVRSPISVVPEIDAIAPAPISGRPQKSNFGCLNPRPRHPVVTILAPSPIAGRPDISRSRAHGLHVNRQHRWSNCDRYGDLSGKR
jgi:hypothetical protein